MLEGKCWNRITCVDILFVLDLSCHEVIVSSGIYSLAKHENISMLGVVCMIYMKGLLCDQGFEGDD